MPDTDAAQRRRIPNNARPKAKAAQAAHARWTPDARARAAIRVLVEQKPPLTEEQKSALRILLARPSAEANGR